MMLLCLKTKGNLSKFWVWKTTFFRKCRKSEVKLGLPQSWGTAPFVLRHLTTTKIASNQF